MENTEKKDREREKSILEAIRNEPTPPSSPEPVHDRSGQRQRQIKKEKREQSKCYRENTKLKQEIQHMKRKVHMYQKRIERAKPNHANTFDSPRTKTRKLLRNITSKETRRCIFMYNVVMEQLRQKYAEKRKKQKASITQVLSGNVLRKYKLKTETHLSLGINTKQRHGSKFGYYSLSKRVCQKVKSFYIRNDNSRMIAGKRQTKTFMKVRKQRRVLLHSLKVLYDKFLNEGKTKLSYSVFCRLRPFFVVFPRQSDRNTCVCKVCDNVQLMTEALHKVKAVKSDDIGIIVNEKVCDTKKHKCMYGECEVCKCKRIEVNKDVLDMDTTWFEWKTKQERRNMKQDGKEIEKLVTLTIKETVEGKVGSLLDEFEDQLERYMKHMYRFNTQYQYYRQRTENLAENECVLNIDLSENYVCKYAHEIQATHFGASKKQITLHTGVAYIKDNPPKTFCSVSPSLQHGPAAVWSHLKPILVDIRSEHPNISTIEIFSDGPATQYKQKGNFYLTSVNASELGFTSIKWSFFESGHGKGTPDAVGGSVKNYADRRVKFGTDISSAEDFFRVLSGSTKTVMYQVPEKAILEEQERLSNVTLKAVSGTLHIHQIQIVEPGFIAYRNLSCECNIGMEHEGHTYKNASLLNKKESTKNEANKSRVLETNAEDLSKLTKNNSNEIKHVSGKKRKQNDQREEENTERKQDDNIDFSKVLKRFSKCKDFTKLKKQCEKLKFEDFNEDPSEISVFRNKLDVDFDAAPDIPDDVPDSRELYPCIVPADGNCLPSCGSVLGFGNTDNSAEMRVRIVNELVLHEERYLNDDCLAEGVTDKGNCNKLTRKYCQYSEYYIPGIRLDCETIQHIYRQEVISITKDASFMGIWQLFALASVLQIQIYSVYPQKGNTNVRKDLNRLLIPRVETSSNRGPVYILWTSTRDDLSSEHWVPNHFVPLLPFEHTVEIATQAQGIEDNETSIVEDNPLQTDGTEHTTIRNGDSNKNTSLNNTDLTQIIGTYVLVNFRGRPYPGFVLDREDTDLQITCMHQLGRKAANCFFWPSKVKDISWYDYEDIISIIPEPVALENARHFRVDESAWMSALGN